MIREKDFLQGVYDLAKVLGWKRFHPWQCIHSEAGYPDLCLLHPGKRRLIYAELKVGKNKPTVEQQGWLDGFKVIPCVETYLWRPEDLDRPPTIREILERGE